MNEDEKLLLSKYCGTLLVKIKGVGEYTVTRHNELLLTFVAFALCILTKKRIETEAGDWKVLNFSAEQKILEVEKIT